MLSRQVRRTDLCFRTNTSSFSMEKGGEAARTDVETAQRIGRKEKWWLQGGQWLEQGERSGQTPGRILDLEPTGLGVGRGGEKGPTVSYTGRQLAVEVVPGFLSPFSPEVGLGS